MLGIFWERPGKAFSGSISCDLSGPPNKSKMEEIILRGVVLEEEEVALTTGVVKARPVEARRPSMSQKQSWEVVVVNDDRLQ